MQRAAWLTTPSITPIDTDTRRLAAGADFGHAVDVTFHSSLRRRRHPLPLLSAAVLVAWLSTLAAQTLSTEGSASIEQRSHDEARREALQRALEEAGMRAGVAISSRDQNGTAMQQRITPRPPNRYRIVREWPASGEYHVQIEAEFDDTPASKSCSYAGQRQYRKTIASTNFLVVNPQHVSDIDNVWDGLPRELMRRLEKSDNLLPTTVVRSNLFSNPQPAQRFEADPELVRRLAQNSNSQFIAVGRLTDAAITGHSTRPFYAWQSDSGSTGQTTQYGQGWQNDTGGNTQGAAIQIPGLPWNAGLQNQPSERRLEVEILLYEGNSGILLQRLRASDTARGRVLVGRDKSFGTENFYSTAFGQATTHVLDTLAKQLEEVASCLPLNARVVKVDGKTAYLDSGAQQNLRPGDTLTLFAPDRNTPVFAGENNIPLGLPEQPLGTIVIKSVQPKFAIGEVRENAGKRVRVGDMARYDEPQPRQQQKEQPEE